MARERLVVIGGDAPGVRAASQARKRRGAAGPGVVGAGGGRVVIGGDAAGMSAASQARKRRDADDLEIVGFERGRASSYSACGIPYWIGGAVGSEEELISRTP